MSRDDKIVNNIEKARTANNSNWMEIVRIALKSNPKETKKVLRRIIGMDEEIKDLMETLVQ
jgi:hypothetical protein